MVTEKNLHELVWMLKRAVDTVYNEEPKLLKYEEISKMLEHKDDNEKELKGLEQAFAFRAGVYFQEYLNRTPYRNLNLDMEYTKKGADPKKLNDTTIRPDMILHERHINDNNILVVEFKGWWNDRCGDKKKLEFLTKQKEEEGFNYLLGIFIRIIKDEAKYTMFENGEIVGNDDGEVK